MDSPVGDIATVIDLLREQLANTYALQNWDGLTLTPTQAKERIYVETMPLVADVTDLVDLRPFAIISKPFTGVTWKRAAAPRHYAATGKLTVEFHRNPGTLDETDPGQLEREFQNWMGRVVRSYDTNNPGLLELAQTAGYLTITQVDEDGPHRTEADEVSMLGNCWLYYLHISWGDSP